MPQTSAARTRAVQEGYRSGLEEVTASSLNDRGVAFTYESHVIRYTKPARLARYTPDFILPNGIIIETKGRFVTADRQKHILITEQHPALDIRFVFSNPRTKISKKSKTTYGNWCEKHGFAYATKVIPDAWLKETPNPTAIEAIEKAGIK